MFQIIIEILLACLVVIVFIKSISTKKDLQEHKDNIVSCFKCRCRIDKISALRVNPLDRQWPDAYMYFCRAHPPAYDHFSDEYMFGKDFRDIKTHYWKHVEVNEDGTPIKKLTK